MNVPDAAIEAAAEAIHPGDYAYPVECSKSIARAALEAAEPHIREAIAAEVEANPLGDHGYAGRIIRGAKP
jgi:RNA polymerase-binding transcription factor DksA